MDVLQCAVYETNQLFFHSQDFYLLQQWRASKMWTHFSFLRRERRESVAASAVPVAGGTGMWTVWLLLTAQGSSDPGWAPGPMSVEMRVTLGVFCWLAKSLTARRSTSIWISRSVGTAAPSCPQQRQQTLQIVWSSRGALSGHACFIVLLWSNPPIHWASKQPNRPTACCHYRQLLKSLFVLLKTASSGPKK